ncbi:MAG: hypothetical protein ACTSRH_16480 [Promethearchaeota archaeon]
MSTENIDEIFDTYYSKVRESIRGIKDILTINFNENDLFFQLGMDNLKALHENIVELLNHAYSPREVRIKLREIEFDEKDAHIKFL